MPDRTGPVYCDLMDREIMTRVCYFDCWFHGRFVTELKQALARQERRTMP